MAVDDVSQTSRDSFLKGLLRDSMGGECLMLVQLEMQQATCDRHPQQEETGGQQLQTTAHSVVSSRVSWDACTTGPVNSCRRIRNRDRSSKS